LNILIYFPYNLRTVEQQSVMEMLVKRGHKVVLLTTCERGYLHDYVETKGVIAEAADGQEGQSRFSFYRSSIKKLKAAIKKHNIDIVIAHQQITALIAGLARKTKKFKLVYVRHNSDEDYQLDAAKAKWYNRLINSLTPVKLAPSSVVENFWKQKEGVASKQIHRINYGYNFDQYEIPDATEVDQIRRKYPAQLRILSMARLVPAKRHSLMFAIVKRLVENGFDCKLICLGSGNLADELANTVEALNMQEHIFLLGRKENIFDYISAADVFLHLSSSEASNSAVKEVGLCKKPVIVCKGVGDFDDYIIHGENGFLVDKEHPEEETYSILTAIAKGEIKKEVIGYKLFETVTTTFDINNIAEKYEQLLNQLVKN